MNSNSKYEDYIGSPINQSDRLVTRLLLQPGRTLIDRQIHHGWLPEAFFNDLKHHPKAGLSQEVSAFWEGPQKLGHLIVIIWSGDASERLIFEVVAGIPEGWDSLESCVNDALEKNDLPKIHLPDFFNLHGNIER